MAATDDAELNMQSSIGRTKVDNALRAIHQKKPIPEIDFTLHTMEDGTQVSTLERVCKGNQPLALWASILVYLRFLNRCTSSSNVSTNR